MTRSWASFWPGLPDCLSPLKIATFVGAPGVIVKVNTPIVRVPPTTTLNWYVPGAAVATRSQVIAPVGSPSGKPPAHVAGAGLVGSVAFWINRLTLGIGVATAEDTTDWIA